MRKGRTDTLAGRENESKRYIDKGSKNDREIERERELYIERFTVRER